MPSENANVNSRNLYLNDNGFRIMMVCPYNVMMQRHNEGGWMDER
jgi:hypothetical protein